METVNKAIDSIFKVIETLAAVLLYGITALAFYQIASRYIFQSAYAGIDEITRLVFVWVASLGSAMAFRAGAHLGVTALINKLGGKWHKSADIIINLILIAFMVIVIIAGTAMTVRGGKQFSEYLRMSMAYFYACIPVGGIVSILVFVEAIFKSLINWNKPETDVPAVEEVGE